MFRLIAPLFLRLAGRRNLLGAIVNNHTLTRVQMRHQLDVLETWFDFITLDQLPFRLTRKHQRPFCVLTFDDGKQTNYLEIAPELERRCIPAAFYVVTNALSSGESLWFDRRNQLVRRLGYCPSGLELNSLKHLPLGLITARIEQARGARLYEDDVTSRPMSWEQVRDLSRRGFTIGAHGASHAILTRETPQAARAEIETSIQRIATVLKMSCRTFAFPNGNFTPELARHAMKCGVTTIMTTDPTWVGKSTLLHQLPRIQLHGTESKQRIELKLALATVPGILANPNGTGRNYRAHVTHADHTRAE